VDDEMHLAWALQPDRKVVASVSNATIMSRPLAR
jgi:hypothetical protein